jgi:hypothetical protein
MFNFLKVLYPHVNTSKLSRTVSVAGRFVHVRVVLVTGRVTVVAGRAVPIDAESSFKLAKLSTTIAAE